MKKKTIYVVIVIAVVAIFSVLLSNDYALDIREASRINIRSGLTGDKMDVTDSELIHNITKNINSLRLKKVWGNDSAKGYAYILDWFDADDRKIISVIMLDSDGCQINCGGDFYKVRAGQSVDIALIEEILTDADT